MADQGMVPTADGIIQLMYQRPKTKTETKTEDEDDSSRKAEEAFSLRSRSPAY